MKVINRVSVAGTLNFETGFHLGSGSEAAGGIDMGVLTDINGHPLLPGSSLKGVFRTTAERLIGHLAKADEDPERKTCFLDPNHPWCAGANQKISKTKLKEIADAKKSEDIEAILQGESLCDTCRLFGSSLARGKLYFKDATVKDWARAVEHRDGVGIDRDSGTAVDKVKYDYEVVPAGASFSFELYGENLTEEEEILVQLVLLEWSRGVRLGGMTSRGLGAAVLTEPKYKTTDLRKPEERISFLVEGASGNTWSLDEIKLQVREYLTKELQNA